MKKTNRKKIVERKKFSLVQKISMALVFLFFLWHNYSLVLLLLVGLLPTLMLFITDRKNKNKLIIVGFLNLSGCIPYILDVAFSPASFDVLLNIIFNVFSWLSMYGFAALGFLFYLVLPATIVFAIKGLRRVRLKQIDRELSKLKEKWGEL